MTIHMIYPEVQCVSEKQIEGWYRDGVANGECNPGCEDDLFEMIRELEDNGKFTFEITHEYRRVHGNSLIW